MQAPPPSGLCPHLPATPSPTSCTPPVILLSLLWQREQAQLHLQLPQLSRRPAANPFHPELPFPFHSRPTPTPGLTVPGSAGGGRARGRQLGAGDLTHHPNTGTLCNTHATLHTDPPVMPVSSCCSKPRAAGPATASLRPPSGTGPGRAVTVRVGQDEGSSWDSRAVGGEAQATAGQRLRPRLEGGRALGPQARSSGPFPTRLPRRQTPKRQPGGWVTRVASACACVGTWAWRAHVGACRKACGTRVHETLLPTRPHGSPADSARGLGVGDLSPRTPTARGTCPAPLPPAPGHGH